MPAHTLGLSHVGLTVPAIQPSLRFFTALGFEKVGGNPDYPSVFVSDGNTLITLWQVKAKTPVMFDRKNNVGLHHLAIKVPSMQHLHRVYALVDDMENVHVEFAPTKINGMPLWHMMCYEPGGIRIEFTYHQ